MTLLDLIPRRWHREPPLPLDLPAAEIPPLVYAEMKSRPVRLHRHGAAPLGTHCGLVTSPFWEISPAKVQGLDPQWCEGCWEGRRCQVCRRPSAVFVECPSCLADGIAVDKAIERRAA